MSEQTEQQIEQIEALFVQIAHGLTSSAGDLSRVGARDPVLCGPAPAGRGPLEFQEVRRPVG